jgi:hypothetical protein
MKWLIFLATLLFIFAFQAKANPTKTVSLKDNQVATIKTAPGYSTILQFDSRPLSVILGDQDAFKVEYIGNGLAIKPILRSSKSNLFVFTNYERFNFKLVTTNSSDVDYVVQVKKKTELPKKILNKKVNVNGIELVVKKTETLENKDLLISFSVISKNKKIRVLPQSFGIAQNDRWLPIENLNISSFNLPATGTITISSSNFNPNKHLLFIVEPYSRSKKLKPLQIIF